MADAKLRCPVCGSEDVAERNGKCVCWDCGHRFDSPASETASDAGRAEVPMKIFMSYGHTEEEIVARIKERLEARGHEVWFDQSEIKSGDDWRESIAEGISSSNGVIACLSKHAFREGGVCHDEIDIAVSPAKDGEITAIASAKFLKWVKPQADDSYHEEDDDEDEPGFDYGEGWAEPWQG